MSISGLVLTLTDDVAAEAALATLAADPRLTLGERFGRRLAAVAETPSVEADRLLWDELRTTPGLANVDVTFVHLDAEPTASVSVDHLGSMEDQHVHR